MNLYSAPYNSFVDVVYHYFDPYEKKNVKHYITLHIPTNKFIHFRIPKFQCQFSSCIPWTPYAVRLYQQFGIWLEQKFAGRIIIIRLDGSESVFGVEMKPNDNYRFKKKIHFKPQRCWGIDHFKLLDGGWRWYKMYHFTFTTKLIHMQTCIMCPVQDWTMALIWLWPFDIRPIQMNSPFINCQSLNYSETSSSCLSETRIRNKCHQFYAWEIIQIVVVDIINRIFEKDFCLSLTHILHPCLSIGNHGSECVYDCLGHFLMEIIEFTEQASITQSKLKNSGVLMCNK